MSVLSRPSLLTDINNNIYTNATEDITGDILQQRLQNIADSDFNKTTDTADNITAGATNKFWTNTILQNIQNGSYSTASASGTDAYLVTLVPAITAYTKGQLFLVQDVATNTIAGVTININGLGVKNVIDYKGAALTVGAFAGSVLIAYDGTSFRMIGSGNLTIDTLTNAQKATLKQTQIRLYI